MAKKESEDLVITEDVVKGIAPSAQTGCLTVQNLDTVNIPGIIRINKRTTKTSSTTITSFVRWIKAGPTGASANLKMYGLTDDGKLYSMNVAGGSVALVSGNTLTSAHGNGLAYWKDYIFVARDAAIDVYGPLSSSPSWTNGWQTWSGEEQDTENHMFLHGQDDILYIGAGRYISSVAEVSGSNFAPGTGASYTWTAQALDLPEGFRVKCLAELGVNLMIGTTAAYNSSTTVYNVIGHIFPWDRISSSFNLPIKTNKNGVHAMIEKDNLIYFMAGYEQELFVTNGSTMQRVAKVPDELVGRDPGNSLLAVTEPGCIGIMNNRIWFGLSTVSATGVAPMGMYSYGDGQLVFEQTISQGGTGTSSVVQVGGFFPNVLNALIGWRDGSTYGIDAVSSDTYYGVDGSSDPYAYYITREYVVGDSVHKKTYNQLTIQLSRPLASGQQVVVSYRTNSAASWTSLFTFSYTTHGAVSSIETGILLTNLEIVQFRVGVSSGNTTTPYLRDIRLRTV